MFTAVPCEAVDLDWEGTNFFDGLQDPAVVECGREADNWVWYEEDDEPVAQCEQHTWDGPEVARVEEI